MRGRRRTGGGLSGEPEYGFGTPTAELPMGGAPERSPSSSEDEYDGPVSDRAHAIMRLPTAPSTREMDEAEMAEAELDDDDEEEAEAVKILMLGDSGVGKTCCMHSFVDGKFASTLMATAGVEFQMKTIRVRTRKHRRKVSLQIWDTAGQERFQKITRAFYKNTHGVVFMYDTCDHKSFDSLQRWVDAMQAEIASTTGMQTILIGNKIDLPNREVSKEEGQAAADKYGMHFFETSAKTGTNVKRAFTTIAQEVVQLQEDMEERQAQATAASAVEAAGNKKCSIS